MKIVEGGIAKFPAGRTPDEARGFGHFDLVVNTRYDADSVARVEALLAECGFSGAQVFGDRNFNFPDADEARIHIAAIRE